MPQYNTSLFYMYVLNGCERVDAVVVVSSRVVKIDGAVVWLFIVAAGACRKLDPCHEPKISVFYINDSDTFSANPTELITTSSHCVVGVNVSSF